MTSENQTSVAGHEAPQRQQPTEERPHCCRRQDDLYAAMDEMGRYATEALMPAPARAFGGEQR
jgi:hypothetical protein